MKCPVCGAAERVHDTCCESFTDTAETNRVRRDMQVFSAKPVQTDDALLRVANAFVTDPAFAECRADEMLWDATMSDGLEASRNEATDRTEEAGQLVGRSDAALPQLGQWVAASRPQP